MPRPTNGVPPGAAGDHVPDGVGLLDLPVPDASAPFPDLTPPAEEAVTALADAGVDLTTLLPDFFFEIA